DDLAGLHLEAEVVDGHQRAAARRAIPLRQTARFECRVHFCRTFFSVEPSSCGPAAMCTPASRSARNLSCAVPLPPERIAPTWRMRLPGGAVARAMKPTTGFL